MKANVPLRITSVEALVPAGREERIGRSRADSQRYTGGQSITNGVAIICAALTAPFSVSATTDAASHTATLTGSDRRTALPVSLRCPCFVLDEMTFGGTAPTSISGRIEFPVASTRVESGEGIVAPSPGVRVAPGEWRANRTHYRSTGVALWPAAVP